MYRYLPQFCYFVRYRNFFKNSLVRLSIINNKFSELKMDITHKTLVFLICFFISGCFLIGYGTIQFPR
jgi:hypothetical protein